MLKSIFLTFYRNWVVIVPQRLSYGLCHFNNCISFSSPLFGSLCFFLPSEPFSCGVVLASSNFTTTISCANRQHRFDSVCHLLFLIHVVLSSFLWVSVHSLADQGPPDETHFFSCRVLFFFAFFFKCGVSCFGISLLKLYLSSLFISLLIKEQISWACFHKNILL